MRHVDDGTIHAWLDAQVTDPAEAAWIDRHLRECDACGARLAGERATRDQANTLLAVVAPVADASRPAFEALVARAAAAAPRAGIPDGVPSWRKWVVPASWAASLVLAAAIGWAVRDVAPIGRESASDARASQVVDAPSASTGIDSPSPASLQTGPSAPPAPPEISGTRAQAQASAPVASARQASRSQAAAAPPGKIGSMAQASVDAVSAEAPPRAKAEPTDLQARRDAAYIPAAPPSSGVAVSPENVLAQATFLGGAVAGEALADPARFAPAPALAKAGGGRGGRGANVEQGVADVQLAAPGAGNAGSAGGITWSPLPRTEAAVRSGMPIYGIDGLTPIATMLSADAMMVRTVYRLDSGETVDVVQQRIAPVAVGQLRIAPTIAGEQPVFSTVFTTGPPAWSTNRGEMRLTLRGAANPEALGARLRLD